MSVQILKDIFFFIGSLLGIIAFVKTIIDPMVESNKTRWKEIKEQIKEEDFIDLEFDIWEARRIREETLNRVRNFVRDIEKDAEYLRFTSILGRRYRQSLQNLRMLYWELRELIQVPYWEPHTFVDEDGSEYRYLQSNKQYFFKNEDGTKAYVDHINAAAELVEKMRVEFRTLSILSNLHSVQIPFASRFITRGAEIPKRIADSTEPPNNGMQPDPRHE